MVSSPMKQNRMFMFDGTLPHRSFDFEGDRYSIVAFCHKSANSLSKKHRDSLEDLGFRLPSSGDCSGGLAPARANAGGASGAVPSSVWGSDT